MKAIPFFRPNIEQSEIDEVVDTLRSGWLTTGPKTKRFEAEFAQYLQQKHAIAVNSCTAALHLALEAIGLQPGQSVVVPTMTFAATAEVVRYSMPNQFWWIVARKTSILIRPMPNSKSKPRSKKVRK